MSNGVFEVLASQDNTGDTRAVIAVQERAKEKFGKFLGKSRNADEFDARYALVSDDISLMAEEVAGEYGASDVANLVEAATSVLAGGHPSGCSCGFCKNKGNLPGAKKDDDGGDDDKKDSDDSDSKSDDSDDKDDDKDSGKPWEKDSKVEGFGLAADVEFDWDGVTASVEKTADGFSFCECDCDGCKDANHCESDQCIKTKHSGNPGNSSGETTSSVEKLAMAVSKKDFVAIAAILKQNGADPALAQQIADYFATQNENFDNSRFMDAAQPLAQDPSAQQAIAMVTAAIKQAAPAPEEGDTFWSDKLDLSSFTSEDGVSDVGSPKIDKSQVPGGGGIPGEDGLAAIDVPSKQHPTEKQDMHQTPEYWNAPIGPSETGKSINADTAIQPEHNVADNTKTWSGTEGQASPVTSAVLAKWSVVTT